MEVENENKNESNECEMKTDISESVEPDSSIPENVEKEIEKQPENVENPEEIKIDEPTTDVSTEGNVNETERGPFANKILLLGDESESLTVEKSDSETKVPEDKSKSVNFYADVAAILAFDPSNDYQTETTKPSETSLKRKNDSLSMIAEYGDDYFEDRQNDENNSKEENERTEDENKNNTEINLTKDEEKFSKPQESSSSDSSDESSDEENEKANSDSDPFSESNECITPPPLIQTKTPKFNKDPLLLDNLPPIETLQISVKEEECVAIGKVFSIVDRLLVIESNEGTPPLMLDSVLFDRIGKPIGQIYDVFGHIKKPFYSVRFNKNEDISAAGLELETPVYCAPKTEHTKYIFTSQLLKEKGSDASWINNEEPPVHCIDFSDDEKEREAKKALKSKAKENGNDDEDDDDVVLLKEERGDSPARKRYLSFEEQMNRNNTMRNKAFKRAASAAEKPWDGGWHNYKRSTGSTTANNRNREFQFVQGTVYRPPHNGNPHWVQQPPQYMAQQRPRALFQFGKTTAFQQPIPQQFDPNFSRPGLRSPGPSVTGYQPPPVSAFQPKGALPQSFQSPLPSVQPPQSFPTAPNQRYPPPHSLIQSPQQIKQSLRPEAAMFMPQPPEYKPSNQSYIKQEPSAPMQPGYQYQQNVQLQQGTLPMSYPSMPMFTHPPPINIPPPFNSPPPPNCLPAVKIPPSQACPPVSGPPPQNRPPFNSPPPSNCLHPQQPSLNAPATLTCHQSVNSSPPAPGHLQQPNFKTTGYIMTSPKANSHSPNYASPPQNRGFQSNHRPPPPNQGVHGQKSYQPRIPFNPGFFSSSPSMQFRPTNVSSFNRTPATFSSYQPPPQKMFPTTQPQPPFQMMSSNPSIRTSSPNFRNRPPPKSKP